MEILMFLMVVGWGVNFYAARRNWRALRELDALEREIHSFTYLEMLIGSAEVRGELSRLTNSQIVDLQRILERELGRRGILKPFF
jgi:hypothetical protein